MRLDQSTMDGATRSRTVSHVEIPMIVRYGFPWECVPRVPSLRPELGEREVSREERK